MERKREQLRAEEARLEDEEQLGTGEVWLYIIIISRARARPLPPSFQIGANASLAVTDVAGDCAFFNAESALVTASKLRSVLPFKNFEASRGQGQR